MSGMGYYVDQVGVSLALETDQTAAHAEVARAAAVVEVQKMI